MAKVQRFTKLFKFLFEDPTFSELPSKAKLLYSLLTERQSLSESNAKQNGIQSQFIDDEGRLFSIYSNEELMNKLNMSKPTIIRLKKQLVSFNLLEETRLGNNQHNRLYPKKPYDNYFHAYDIDEFYRLPHDLFENPNYKYLSADSIIAYSFYLSRYEYSVYKNHFSDDKNNIYCVLTNEELALRLSCERKKVTRIKNELISCGLLISQKSTLGKADRIYVNLPESRHIKEVKKWDTSDIDFSNTYISNIDFSDTNDMNDRENNNLETTNNTNHSSHTNHENKSNENTSFDEQKAEQDMLLQQLPKDIQLSLKHFTNQEITCIKTVLNKAKKNYNTYAPVEDRITFEDCAFEISEALRRLKLFGSVAKLK